MRNKTQEFEKSIIIYQNDASKLVVKDDTSLEQASVFLTNVNKILKSIGEEKDKVLKPLNEAVKAERARWKPIETVYETLVADVRAKMSSYQTEKFNKAQIQTDKIAARIGEGKGKIKLETASAKIAAIEQPEKKVASISFREDKVLKIVDINQIPRSYMVVDEKAVKQALKDGINVPGAVLETVLTPVDRG